MIQRQAVRWVKNDYSHYSSVTHLQNTLNGHNLENRRIDSKLVLFYKVYHHLVAISLPLYLEVPTRFNRHMHPLSLCQTTQAMIILNTLSSLTPQSCGTGYPTSSQRCLILRASSRQLPN